MTTYQYAGNGGGVPGLPFVISDEEAAAQGLSEALREAIENGNYRAIEAPLGLRPFPPDVGRTPKSKGRKSNENEGQP